MAFTEMMSSGRGPGVIGMLMALFVLIGFGFLFMFAADEELQGGGQSIEAVIRYQTRDIENLQGAIEKGQKELKGAPERLKNANQVSRHTRGSESLKARAQELGNLVKKSSSEVDQLSNAFEAYKDSYRALVRGKAKGESIGKLTTTTGAEYENTNIREVTAVGIQIRHDGGQKRIPYEELPPAMIDRFQFDAKQKAAAIENEQKTWNEHEAAVAAAESESARKSEERAAKEAENLRQNTIRQARAAEAKIESLTEEIRSLQQALILEAEKRLSRAPAMREQLAAKQSQLDALRAQLARMNANP